ncbi:MULTISPECIES: hypothetical protein [unclassified Sphingomonas]|uniref:hypothetical protein n=1 Tax=unclassified Sphingomonas TaxID=196159 RepID=UPI00226A3BC0|nr:MULTISPECIES: hypothetical protein [unclassified Sphingomonas]
MLELRILTGATALPLFDLPAALGRRQAAKEVGNQIDALMAFLDDLGGDPDLEDGHDAEADNSDAENCSYPEWHTLDRADHRAGRFLGRPLAGGYPTEDIEQDDPGEDDDSDRCTAGDDHMIAGPVAMREWWQDARNPGDEIDGEIERGDDGQAWPEVGAGKQPTCMNVDYMNSEDAEPAWCGNFAKDVLDGTFAANDR